MGPPEGLAGGIEDNGQVGGRGRQLQQVEQGPHEAVEDGGVLAQVAAEAHILEAKVAAIQQGHCVHQHQPALEGVRRG